MNHFGVQNGPFCDVKRIILKIVGDFSSILSDLFTTTITFGLKKRKKIEGTEKVPLASF